jgi:hypothetical protein
MNLFVKENGLCYNFTDYFHDIFLLGISENSVVRAICIIYDKLHGAHGRKWQMIP